MTCHVSALFKVAKYRLDDSEKFNDEDFYEFVESFKFLHKLNNLNYLIEKDSQGKDKDGPPGSNRILDNSPLFSVLRMNISKIAYRIIGQYAAEQDGVKAWEASADHYETTDIGSLVGLLVVKRQMTWDGSDERSFDEFIGEYLDIVTKLESRGWTSPDYILAGDLLERVSIEYTTQNPIINLKNPMSLTFAHIKDAIKSNIRLMQNKTTTAAFLAKANNNKNNNSNDHNQQNRYSNQKNANNGIGSNSQKVTTPCGNCQLMSVPDEKAMHPEKNCWNEKRFPELPRMLKDQKGNGTKETAIFENSFAHLAVKDSDEEEACFMASESVKVRKSGSSKQTHQLMHWLSWVTPGNTWVKPGNIT